MIRLTRIDRNKKEIEIQKKKYIERQKEGTGDIKKNGIQKDNENEKGRNKKIKRDEQREKYKRH